MADFLHYLTFGFLWQGLLVAAAIAFFSFVLAMPLAVLLALVRLSRSRTVRVLPVPFVWLMRGTPLLLQLVFWYNFLPRIGLQLTPEATAVIGLGLNEVAFSAEIIRGGFQGVRQSQRDAAAALGMPARLTLFRITLPQALRSIVPSLANEAIVLIKNTSLASVIAVGELTLRSQQIVSANFKYVVVFAAASVLYLLATSIVSLLQRWSERKLDIERKGQAAARALVPRLAGGAEPALAGRTVVRRRIADPRLDGEGETVAPEQFVCINEARKSIHGKVILDGVNLRVPRGTVTVVLGPSGSGKTTLLRTVNHLEPIDSGEITVAGRLVGYRRTPSGIVPVRKLAAARAQARIGMVFQSFNLFDHLTVMENLVEAPVRVCGQPRKAAEEYARELLAWAGLAGYENLYPHQLSGGQQQRVAIARALATDPVLMLFDEPTSALDPELVEEVLRLIRKLADDGMSMLVVTHELSFARDSADQIVFMDGGKVIETGPPEQVLDAPREERTRQFLRVIERGVPQP